MRLQLLCRVKESAGWRGRALAELSRRSGTSRVYLLGSNLRPYFYLIPSDALCSLTAEGLASSHNSLPNLTTHLSLFVKISRP